MLRSRPRRALASCLAIALLLAAPAPAAQVVPAAPPTEEQSEALAILVECLRSSDMVALGNLVDFEARQDERAARGLAERAWAQLDGGQRSSVMRSVTRDWTRVADSFMSRAVLTDVEPRMDPDAGLGPVPDRRLFELTLANGREQLRLLVWLTPRGSVLDLQAGEAGSPEVASQLEPLALLSEPVERGVRWPLSTERDEQRAMREAVEELLGLPPGAERAMVIEELHVSARSGAAALVERLLEYDESAAPDPHAMALLDAVLAHVTGRAPSFLVEDEAQRTRTVEAWLRWHRQRGTSFETPPTDHELDPALAALDAAGKQIRMDRWGAKLAANVAGAGEDPGSVPAAPPPGSGSSTAAGDGPPAGPAPPAEPKADEPGGTNGSPPAPPPSLRAPHPRKPNYGIESQVLLAEAAGLTLVHHGRKLSAREIESQLTPALRASLNSWAPTIERLGLQAVVGSCPEALVLGGAPLAELQEASAIIDDTWRLLDPVIPILEGRTPARAVVAVVMDAKSLRSSLWSDLLDDLVVRSLIIEAFARSLREDPGGVSVRHAPAPFFLQPNADLAGNAAAGDDEFRFGNEVAHKLAQCLLTARVGDMPGCIRWGLGEVAEIARFGTVYQFNSTGFVSSGDHFDWPQKARQELEKRAGRSGFSLGAQASDERAAGQAAAPQIVTWAALGYLVEKQPHTLAALLQELSEVQAAADTYGLKREWAGEKAATLAALKARLDTIDVEALRRWLASLKR